MNKLFYVYTNIRFNIVALLGIVAFIMMCDETDRSLLSFFGIKAIAVGIALLAFRLAKYWHAKGYFKDVEEACKEEDED